METGLTPSERSGIGPGDPGLVDPTVIELEYPDRTIVPDWIAEEWVHEHPIDGLATLVIKAVLTKGFLVNVGSPEQPHCVPIEEALPDNTIVRLVTSRGGPADQVIFEGYPERYYTEGASDGQGGSQLYVRVVCEAAPALMGGEEGTARERYFVFGQPMLRKDDIDAMATNPEHEPAFRINRALECIGNPDSVGNCRRTLVDMEIEGAGGETFPLPLFQHPLAPANFREAEARQPWSMARWLLMLLAWPRLVDGEPGVTKLAAWEYGRFRLGDCVDGRDRRDIVAIIKDRNLELANPAVRGHCEDRTQIHARPGERSRGGVHDSDA